MTWYLVLCAMENFSVVCKAEKPTGHLIHKYTFMVTNMNPAPEELVSFYCKRDRMEN